MRARVLSSLDIGNWTALMPRGPQAMPQRPIAVSNIAKWCSVMAGSNWLTLTLGLHGVSSMLEWNLGLENVAIHPDSDGIWRRPAVPGFEPPVLPERRHAMGTCRL